MRTLVPWWPHGTYAEVHLDVAGRGGRYGRQDIFDCAHLTHGHGGCARGSSTQRGTDWGHIIDADSSQLLPDLAGVPGALAFCVTPGKLLNISGPQ